MAGKVKDLTGQRFGRLIVIERAPNGKRGNSRWVCHCDCEGPIIIVTGYHLGVDTNSCGCLQRALAAKNIHRLSRSGVLSSQYIHGHTKTVKGKTQCSPEFHSYDAAKARCNNPLNNRFANYGGRGIKFRFNSFEEFLAEVGLKPEPKHLYSIGRIDGDFHYMVGNVEWQTREQQTAERENRRTLQAEGLIVRKAAA